MRWWRDRAGYLGLLRDAPLRQELDQSNRQCATLALVWLTVVALECIVGGFHPGVPVILMFGEVHPGFSQGTYVQWTDTASLVILILWPLTLLAEWLQTRSFMRHPRASNARQR